MADEFEHLSKKDVKDGLFDELKKYMDQEFPEIDTTINLDADASKTVEVQEFKDCNG